MAQTAPASYSPEDRAAFARLKDEIAQGLRALRAQAEATWEVARRIYQAHKRLWWKMDHARSVERWARAAFDLSARQLRKYLRIGEHLTQADVAGVGLCIDALVQVALSPAPLRKLLIALSANEGLSPAALSSGRRRALAKLQAGDVAGALAEAERAARARAQADELKEDGPKKVPGAPKPAPAAPAEVAHRHLRRAIAALGDGGGEGDDGMEQTRQLLRAAEERLGAIVARSAASAAVPAEVETTAAPLPEDAAEGATPDRASDSPSSGPESPEEPSGTPPAAALAPPGVDFAPILAIIERTLDADERDELRCKLNRLARGAVPAPGYWKAFMIRLLETDDRAAVDPIVAKAFLDTLLQPERRPRAVFTRWLCRVSRLSR